MSYQDDCTGAIGPCGKPGCDCGFTIQKQKEQIKQMKITLDTILTYNSQTVNKKLPNWIVYMIERSIIEVT